MAYGGYLMDQVLDKEFLAEVFPAQRTEDFFDALFGGWSLEAGHRFSYSGTLWKRDTFGQTLRAWYPCSGYGTYYSFEFRTNVHPP